MARHKAVTAKKAKRERPADVERDPTLDTEGEYDGEEAEAEDEDEDSQATAGGEVEPTGVVRTFEGEPIEVELGDTFVSASNPGGEVLVTLPVLRRLIRTKKALPVEGIDPLV